MLYLSTAIGLTPGGSSTVHIYTQTIHRTTQNKQYIEQHNNLGECGPCPVLASYTLAFALQLRKKHGKTSVRVAACSLICTAMNETTVGNDVPYFLQNEAYSTLLWSIQSTCYMFYLCNGLTAGIKARTT